MILRVQYRDGPFEEMHFDECQPIALGSFVQGALGPSEVVATTPTRIVVRTLAGVRLANGLVALSRQVIERPADWPWEAPVPVEDRR